MKVKTLLVSVGLLSCICKGSNCLRISHENNISEEDFAGMKSDDSALQGELYHALQMGPEKLPIEIFEQDRNGLKEEAEKENLPEPVVDEETIRKAEEAADKDLLYGLNRILKNNETLKDVFRTENVYETP